MSNLRRKKEVRNDWSKLAHQRVTYVPPGLTESELIDLSKTAFRRFYLRPRIVLQFASPLVDPERVETLYCRVEGFCPDNPAQDGRTMNLRRALYYVLWSSVVGSFLGLLDFAVFSLGVAHFQFAGKCPLQVEILESDSVRESDSRYSGLGVLGALLLVRFSGESSETGMPISSAGGLGVSRSIAAVLDCGNRSLRFFRGSARDPEPRGFFGFCRLVGVGLIVVGIRRGPIPRRFDSADVSVWRH